MLVVCTANSVLVPPMRMRLLLAACVKSLARQAGRQAHREVLRLFSGKKINPSMLLLLPSGIGAGQRDGDCKVGRGSGQEEGHPK